MKRRIALLLCALIALAAAVAPEGVRAATLAATVSLSASNITLEAGGPDKTACLAVTVTPEGADEALQWVTSNAKVATVSADGVVTAVGKGKCVVGVRGSKSGWAKCYVTVTQGSGSSGSAAAPASVRFDQTSATLAQGETWQVPHSVSPAELSAQAQWVTTNAKVATVSSSGLVKAVGKGACVIGLRVPGSSWVKCKLTVTAAKSTPASSGPAPAAGGGVTFASAALALDLGSHTTAKMQFTVDPADQAGSLEWVTTNAKIATVAADGTVTAHGAGACAIGARLPGGKWAKCKVTVAKAAAPKSITVEKTSVVVAPGGSITLAASIQPANANQGLLWASADKSIVTVDASGTLTAVGKGVTQVYVRSAVSSALTRQIRVTVSESAPTAVVTDQTVYTVARGATFTIPARAEPATALQSFTYLSSNTGVVSVSADGTMRALKEGKAVVRIYSAEDKGVFASVGIKVSGALPASVTFGTSELYFVPGDSVALTPTVVPTGAATGLSWASSDPSVVSVGEDGRAAALKPGASTVTVTTTVGGLQASVRVTVLSVDRTTVVPARWSGLADLKSNLAKIDAIRESAFNAVSAAATTGSLSASEAAARRQIIQRAFAMYRFPWVTNVDQPYWRSSASLGGLKDYKAGVIYYGLPYIQCGKTGDYGARRFSEQNAVSGGYYTDTGRGYYQMSQTRKFDGMYAGNDCSSFVSIAQWGLGAGHSYDYTDLMVSTYAYRNVANPRAMQPGDLLVKSGHCLLFLYYTDDARTQMMVIEQGGGSSADVHNTVACSVVNVAAYTSTGYVIRRQATFAP